MFKIDNKDTKTTSLTLFLVLNIFISSSSVSIADFEPVNVSWELSYVVVTVKFFLRIVSISEPFQRENIVFMLLLCPYLLSVAPPTNFKSFTSQLHFSMLNKMIEKYKQRNLPVRNGKQSYMKKKKKKNQLSNGW